MKVAYYSPLPPERSGIADYSALLLPALSGLLEVEVMKPGRRRRRGVDLGLFHIGNSPEAHGWIFDALRSERGLVVLHEYVVHHLVAGVTVGRGEGSGYLDAMQREAGVVGRLLAHGVIDGLVPPLWERRAVDFPLVREVLAHADGLIVHSRFVEERVREAGYAGPVFRIAMPAWPHVDAQPATLPRPGRPVFGCFGFLNPARRVPQLLQAFARLRVDSPEAMLLFAGGSYGLELDDEIERAGLRDAAFSLGYVPETELWSLLAACDVSVSLRSPTMGETSAVAVRALSAGKPLVVSDVGWFSELPDEVAIKVPLGDAEVDALVIALRRVADDVELRAGMGTAALRLARDEHDLGRVAVAYAAACEDVAARPQVEQALLRNVAGAAADVGLDGQGLRQVAGAVREVTRGS